MLRIYVLCALLIVQQLECATDDRKPCITPDGKEGVCTHQIDCPSLDARLGKQLTSHDVVFIQRSYMQCAGIADADSLCCQSSNKTVGKCNYPVKSQKIKRSAADDRSLNTPDEVEDPLPKNCGRQTASDKIIHGVLASLDEFPWMALLKYKTPHGEGYGCGGTLISKRYVLTAAHCTIGRFGPPVEVTLGEYDVNTEMDCSELNGFRECTSPPQFIPIEEITKYPDYLKIEGSKLHDIALIRLKRLVEYNDFVMPICLPNANIYDAKMMDIAGWGKTKHMEASNIKRKAKVPIVDRETCSKNRTVKVTDTQICAGGGRQDTCSGDSGGPLMCIAADGNDPRWYVAGIVSYGTKSCGVPGIPAVYTNVLPYKDWIIKNMKP